MLSNLLLLYNTEALSRFIAYYFFRSILAAWNHSITLYGYMRPERVKGPLANQASSVAMGKQDRCCLVLVGAPKCKDWPNPCHREYHGA